MAETAKVEHDNPVSSGRRRWLFRLAAIALGLSVFVGIELICVVFDWGRPADYEDPFAGFSSVHPLFVLDESGENYVIPQARLKFFARESFPAKKRNDTFRIFVLGGSTVQGRPYSKETAFPTWLELSLKAADPSRNWEVVNCGGISYATYRLVPILRECLNYEPDLFIFCEGHNEFLEDRTYDHIKHAPELLAATQRTLARLRSYVLLREGLMRVTGQGSTAAVPKRPLLKGEVDAMLDHRGGLEAYHRDDQWRAGVIAHFEHALRQMAAIAESAGVPLLMVLPPSNLSDCAPFKSEHRAGLTAEQLRRWTSLVESAREQYRNAPDKSVALLNEAIQIDGQYANTFYELGQCYESLSLWPEARTAFVQARDLDICPLRMITPLEDAMRKVADETDVPLLDAHALLEQECPNGILGDYLLVDRVHPSFTGHQMIANALTELMVAQGFLKPAADWQTAREAAYREHFASLDPLYFLHGQRTAESVVRWTQGKAKGPPLRKKKR